ncbi:TPA: hypothetical protein DD449_04345 [Candidatus Berkelbacteria bacterium]|uniref:Uncharacterized protein n=1 Tax=Berkelbacteria bacterium GW2011_GWE1_39_12 TaxID=1618337 RepID=A0A0G4B376_9BACT|nr:MAG: hypothetical protein UT28_C0001G0489 [Berkelbacteria bacterium GW2011_GWE1_39_12]HBO60885.1 hypothetical protein [Candidatus Berkelbacteria bacterium]
MNMHSKKVRTATSFILVLSFFFVTFFGTVLQTPKIAKAQAGEVTDICKDKCPGGTWWWKVDDNIRNAICNMQCTIIDWEATMIGWVIGKVLYPALGLCKEGDPSRACPTMPITDSDPTRATPTPTPTPPVADTTDGDSSGDEW